MAPRASASQAEILESLERASGVTLRTRIAVSAYVAAIGTGGTCTLADRRGWVLARHSALAVALAIATLQYYFMDVYVQIASLPSITVLGITPPAKSS